MEWKISFMACALELFTICMYTDEVINGLNEGPNKMEVPRGILNMLQDC